MNYQKIYKKYKDIIDIDKEIDKSNLELNELRDKYKNNRDIYKKLKKEVATLEGDLDMMSFGVYKPHFNFETSEEYKEEIKKIRQQQKGLIKSKQAIKCYTDWTVDGSRVEGRKTTNKIMRLMLRAFNNECDASVLKVNWKNVYTIENRIEKSFELINRMGEGWTTEIQDAYKNLKIKEIYAAHEYQEKKYEEKEEQREIREQMREEEKLVREIEQAKKEALRDAKALEKAKKQLNDTHGKESEKLQKQIEKLEQALKKSEELKERAISRAQMTKAGHVYVISNIGSFGEDVYKIGMTRRLEPMLRVKELGDASVPFIFDVHAMIFSENAPELEKKLHNSFEDKRVNMVNKRKEFFKVSLSEIEKIVLEENAEIEFTLAAYAKDYRQTLQILEEEKDKKTIDEIIDEEFPQELD